MSLAQAAALGYGGATLVVLIGFLAYDWRARRRIARKR